MTEQRKEELREALREATVYVVAHDGLDKATTKALASRAGVNEGYIYRVFDGKEDLLAKTFTMLDGELAGAVFQNLPVMHDESMDIEMRCYKLFLGVWEFLLSYPDRCLCFIRYYYSPYFQRYSLHEHEQMFAPATKRFARVFKEGTDVWRMLDYMLDAMLTSAFRLFRGDFPDTEKTQEEVFTLVYCSVRSHLNWSKQVDRPTDR